jgi:hypothetical protein
LVIDEATDGGVEGMNIAIGHIGWIEDVVMIEIVEGLGDGGHMVMRI